MDKVLNVSNVGFERSRNNFGTKQNLSAVAKFKHVGIIWDTEVIRALFS